MKIYITRPSAGSVMSGGLERLNVWFSKPVYVEFRFYDPDELPIGPGKMGGSFTGGYWQVERADTEVKSFSFGKVFGYSDSEDENINLIAQYVWGQLEKHFQEKPIHEWMTLEKEDKVHPSQFFLELEIDIKLKT